jgi:hypothetical protein
MIIGFGLLFIAYALASFAIIQGLIFPHLAQGAPVAAITRLTGREQPPLSLVQNRLKRLEPSLDGGDEMSITP